MALSLIQSAALTGRSKSTIHRAIKTGKLSATRNDDGSYSIDPAELFRAYPKEPTEPANTGQSATPKEPPVSAPNDAALLQLKVDMLTVQLEREQETVSDLRKRLDRAEDRLLALTAQPQSSAAPRGLWGRLWGRR